MAIFQMPEIGGVVIYPLSYRYLTKMDRLWLYIHFG
jgi:hypothetical protein